MKNTIEERRVVVKAEGICALFVTYHPDDGFTERLGKILVQVDRVVVVDNGSNQKAQNILKKIADNKKVMLILNKTNLGVAKALNQGMEWIKENNYSFALTLDQDTIPCKDQVKYLLEVYMSYSQNFEIGIVGSNYSDIDNDDLVRFNYDRQKYLQWKEKKTVITSGSLIPLSTFIKIGPFRDDFFIDHLDHEFCLRARSKGFKIIVALKPIMQHSIGQQTTHRFFFFKIKTTNQSVERNYYGSRNHALLMREYFLKEPFFMLKLLIVKIRTTLFICIYEKEKLTKMKYIIRGYRDGMA